MKKRLLAIILSVAILISLMPAVSIPVLAEEQNQIGDNVFWTFDSDTATLTVKGTGPTYDFDYDIFCKMLGLDIKHIVIEEGVTYIGNMCFQGCSIVEDVVFSNTVKAIGDLSFSGCSSITKLTIPGSLKTIGVSAFNGLYILSDLTIENGVETIKEGAFACCYGLTDISIPASVSTIESWFAGSCDNLCSITVDEQNEHYCSIDGVLYTKDLEKLVLVPYAKEGMLRVPDGVKTIVSNAISNEHLTGLFFPDTVEVLETGSIGLHASCTELHLGNGLKTLCDSAIYSGGVSEIVLPASVEYIGVEAIHSSNTLKKVVVLSKDCEIAELNRALGNPDYVVIYGYDGSTAQEFAEKLGYQFVTIDGSEYDNRVGDNAYWTYDSATSTLTIEGAGPTYDYSQNYYTPFYYCWDIKHIVIKDGITYLGDWLFWNRDKVEDISIPNSVTAIAKSTFAGCTSLTKISIPGSVKTIDEGTFSCCYSLSEVTIENGVEEIKFGAFSACESMTSISFPASVSFIDNVFYEGNYNLSSITVDEKNEHYCSIDGALYTKDKETLLLIPPGRDDVFRVPEGVKVIASHASDENGKLTGLILPNTVETLESYSLYLSTSCIKLDLGTGLKTICDYAITTHNVPEIVLPESVEYIGKEAIIRVREILKKIIILSQDCEIYDYADNFRGYYGSPVIYGYQDSTIQTYAEKYGYGFKIVGCEEGVHDYTVTEEPATCTETGSLNYKCKKCSSKYSEEIPALGHDYKGKTTRNPTCTAVGQTTYTCTRCNDSYSEEDIPALGHNYVSKVTSPTCTEKGYTKYTCSRCGDTYTGSETAALGHSYVAKITAPTCTEKGYTTHTCSRCGDSYTDTYTDAAGHSYTEIVVKPSCTGQGYTEHTCSRCGNSYKENYIAALGHDWDDGVITKQPTETTTGVRTYTCKRCNVTRTAAIPQLDHVHSYTAVVTPPTCTENGYTTHTCACGDSYVDSEVEAIGHDYKSIVTAPTCTEEGYTIDTCTRCGSFVRHSEVAALGHDYKTTVTKPTCTEKGFATHVCSRCGDTFQDSEVDALGHDWAKGKEKKPASVFETGIMLYTCSRCAETKEEQTPILASCTGGNGCPTLEYIDVPAPSNWAHAGIDFCVYNGLMGSTSTEKLVFSPGNKTSRAMIVVILYRLEGSPDVSYVSVFNDVPDGTWFTKGILWAQNNGIVTGYGNGRFGPTDTITREQLATIMQRYTTYKKYKTNQTANLSSFPDNQQVSGWAQRGVAWAVGFGLINGKGNSSGTILDPKGNATRAETASILMRFIQRQDELEPLNDPKTCTHNWVFSSHQDATCTQVGKDIYICSECNSEKAETTPLADHKYTVKTTAPTCTTGGYDTYTCSVCGKSYTANSTSALGHNYVNGACSRCGAKDPNTQIKELNAEEIYAKCSPAVFSIITYDKFKNPLSQGSGFFVSSNGVAVTNAHVVKDAEYVNIIMSDGRSFWADSLIGGDSLEDWAVLKVNVTGMPYLPIGSKSTVVGGASIYAIGSPEGLSNTISTGIISNPNRIDAYGCSVIQITASISHGSSGGALINKYGQVIGITSGTLNVNGNDLYYAMPIQYASTILRANGVSCPD